VLKKAGIVVATAAAGLLAVSPLAFAGDKDDHDHGRDHDDKKKVKVEDVNHIDDSNKGLINVSDNNVNAQVCTNDVDVVGVVNDITGVLNLFNKVELDQSDVTECAQKAGDKFKQKNDD
jgi:hypothetical protein